MKLEVAPGVEASVASGFLTVDGERAGPRSGPPALGELGDYTVKHFEQEEAYLESISYSGLANHKAIHADLLETFSVKSAKKRSCSRPRVSMAFHSPRQNNAPAKPVIQDPEVRTRPRPEAVFGLGLHWRKL